MTWFARDAAPRAPSPKYSGVGPHSAIRMLADAATAVSCDGAKSSCGSTAETARRRLANASPRFPIPRDPGRGPRSPRARRLPRGRPRRSGHRVGRRHARGESVQAPWGGGHTTGTGRRRDARARRARRRAGGGTLVRGRRGERRGHSPSFDSSRRRGARRRDARRRALNGGNANPTRPPPRPRRFVRRS